MPAKPIFLTSAPSMEYLVSQVTKKIGYPSRESAPKNNNNKIQSIIEKGLTCIETSYLYKASPIIRWDKSCIIGKEIVIDSTKWATLLNHMQSPFTLYCFALTLGEALDKMIKTSQEKSLFEAFVMDAFGSVVTEYEADQLTHHLKTLPENASCEFSRRFSPGYCDWKLQPGQNKLFQFIEPNAISLTCLPSGAMVPVKSITAVMIGAKKIKKASPCFFCNEGSCAHRRIS
jgi:hypothetical protein